MCFSMIPAVTEGKAEHGGGIASVIFSAFVLFLTHKIITEKEKLAVFRCGVRGAHTSLAS